MKQKLSLLMLLCMSSCIAQVGYKKIMIYKIDGGQIQGFAKNFRFNREPQQLLYYLKKGSKPQTLDLDSIARIQYKKKDYIVADVEFDNTTNDYQKLDKLGEKSWNKFFFLEKKRLYLKVLVDGKIPLYMSYLNNVSKFFIKNEDGDILPLLYKRYFKPRPLGFLGPNFARENNFYKQQLSTEAPCRDKKGMLTFPEYKEFNLVAYFKRFNTDRCN